LVRRSKESWFRTVSQTVAWRYGVALVAFLVSFFVRDLLNNWLIGISDRGLIIFLPAILLVTFFLGLGPAILTALLSALDSAVVLAAFVVGTGVAIALVDWLRTTITAAEEAEARAAADLRDMARLNQLSNRLVREGSDEAGNLNAVLDTAIAITGAVKGTLRLLDPTNGVLTLAAQRGFQEPFLSFFAAMPVGASAYAAAMKSGERVIIENMRESEILAGHPSKEVLLDAGVCAVTSTPLMASTRNLLGMISTHFAKPHSPSERELRLIDLLARQTADYLERKRADQTEKTLEPICMDRPCVASPM
jgi:GAF domain